MSKEKELLDKELNFNYQEELEKIQNHISKLRFISISSVNTLEDKEKENKQLHSIIKEVREYCDFGIENWITDDGFVEEVLGDVKKNIR